MDMRFPLKRHPAVPGPSGYPLVCSLPHFWRQPLQYLTAASHRYGEMVALRLRGQPVYLLNHPDHITDVLADHHTRYRKSARGARRKPLFGEGPRGCLGQRLAMLEMVLILAMVAQRYQLRLKPGHPLDPEPLITLRPRDGVLMTVHPHPR
jgi:cytochrome P450